MHQDIGANLPASRIDMTEQRKSLPQAEILLKYVSCMFVASKSYLYLAQSVRVLVTALRSHDRTSSQSQPSGYPHTKKLDV
jgi:hypothetical protein